MKAFRSGSILLGLFELLVGILLLVNPVGFTSGIIIAAGAVLLIMGLAAIVNYFRMTPEFAASSQSLLKGLVLLVAGGFCAFRSEWFTAAFPILTFLYGVIILLTALRKVQWAVDAIRLKLPWGVTAISAAASLLFAIVILANPFTTTTVLWRFTGIALIAEAVIDIMTLLVKRKNAV